MEWKKGFHFRLLVHRSESCQSEIVEKIRVSEGVSAEMHMALLCNQRGRKGEPPTSGIFVIGIYGIATFHGSVLHSNSSS